MNQIKRLIPLLAFVAYFGKTLAQSPGYPEVLVLGILAAAFCFFELKIKENKHDELEQKVNSLQNSFDEKTKEIENLKTTVTSLKLSSGMRAMGSR